MPDKKEESGKACNFLLYRRRSTFLANLIVNTDFGTTKFRKLKAELVKEKNENYGFILGNCNIKINKKMKLSPKSPNRNLIFVTES